MYLNCECYKKQQQHSMSEQFYHDMLKILSDLYLEQVISLLEKEQVKSIVLNADSSFVTRLKTIHITNSYDRNNKITNEVCQYIRNYRNKKPYYLKNKQMRTISEEQEEQEDQEDQYKTLLIKTV